MNEEEFKFPRRRTRRAKRKKRVKSAQYQIEFNQALVEQKEMKKKLKDFNGIELNGTSYYEDSRCPSCSGERDTGGRLKLKKRARYFLKCEKCRYSILGKKTQDKKDRYFAKLDGLKY